MTTHEWIRNTPRLFNTNSPILLTVGRDAADVQWQSHRYDTAMPVLLWIASAYVLAAILDADIPCFTMIDQVHHSIAE